MLKTMPWKNTDASKERLLFVAEALKREEPFIDLCSRYQISRPTGYKWLERFNESGPSGLCELSRAPHHRPHQLSEEICERLLKLKLAHRTWGPKKIRDYLKHQGVLPLPAASTIGELFDQHQLIKKRKHRLPINRDFYEIQQSSPKEPNDVWGVDFKGQFLVGSQYIYPLTVSDLASRYLLGCEGLANTRTKGAVSCFEEWFNLYGLPLAIRTDNGVPFGAPNSRTGLTRLSRYWIQLGIRLERIIPGHPQQNGIHERMHRTLKAETARPASETFEAQQRRFNDFQFEYNCERPHEALRGKAPVSAYKNSERRLPRKILPPEYPSHFEVRKVKTHGEIKFKGLRFFLSEVLTGDYVGIEKLDESLIKVHFYHQPILELDLRDKRWVTL
jgi:transposase InsO family protein